MDIRITNKSTHPLPAYETLLSAGMDLRAYISEPIVLKPMQRVLIPTGLSIELTEGLEAQIRPRSGLAFKNGVTVLNSPGTIDADYRGEIKVLLVNLSDTEFMVNNGDRIAQMVISHFVKINWKNVESLSETKRGAGGFGHTGSI
jgi:dUTP pyrophosphatase